MQEILLALIAGLIVGFIFTWIKLPIPSPPALAGIIGILGVYLGHKLFHFLFIA